MAGSKISESCVVICLLGLTSVTYVTLGDSGIAGKHGVSVAQSPDQASCISEAVDQSTLLFSFSFICTCFIIQYKVQCILLLYSTGIYYNVIFYCSSYSLLLNASWANDKEWQSALQRHIL